MIIFDKKKYLCNFFYGLEYRTFLIEYSKKLF